jgi:hypothetical protein
VAAPKPVPGVARLLPSTAAAAFANKLPPTFEEKEPPFPAPPWAKAPKPLVPAMRSTPEVFKTFVEPLTGCVVRGKVGAEAAGPPGGLVGGGAVLGCKATEGGLDL